MLCATFVLSCAPTYGDDKSNLKSKTTIEVRNVSTSYDTETYQQYRFEHKKTYYVYDSYFQDNDVPYLRELPRQLKYSFYAFIHDEPQYVSVLRNFGVEWSFVVKGELHKGDTLSLEHNRWYPVTVFLGEITDEGKASGTAVVKSLNNEYVTIAFEDVSFEGNSISLCKNPPSKQYTFNGVVKYKRKKYNE